jgi:maleylpyruvate isomerase
MSALRLHGYFRSSAAWRVRIALNLKDIPADLVSHHLVKGEQLAPEYLRLNPQGLVPALETEGAVLTQSLAIIEYLEETHPEPPLLPADPVARAQVRAVALAIACDIHPLQNLRVLRRLRKAGLDKDEVNEWGREVVENGLEACAQLMAGQPGPFCFGAAPGLADLCLVPQMANARRYGASTAYGRLPEIESACAALPAFKKAHPDQQPDAE